MVSKNNKPEPKRGPGSSTIHETSDVQTNTRTVVITLPYWKYELLPGKRIKLWFLGTKTEGEAD